MLASALIRQVVRRCPLAAASGHRLTTCLISADASIQLLPLEQSRAVAILRDWLLGWLAGLCRPLPVAVETAFAFLQEADESKQWDKARACYEGSSYALGERDKNVALQRSYPDFASLIADEEFAGWPKRCIGHW